LLCRKDDALNTTKDFAAVVETQNKTKIQEWMSDAEGEYKLINLKESRSYRAFHINLNKMVMLKDSIVLLWIRLRLFALLRAYLNLGESSQYFMLSICIFALLFND